MYYPDELDAGILRELQSPASRWNARESYTRIAKKLQVDEETVRRRVAKMQGLGVIQGWTITPNPHLLGRECIGLYIELPNEPNKQEVIDALRKVDGVLSVNSFHGNSILVFVDCLKETPPAAQVAPIEELCGAKSVMLWTAKFPPFELDMTLTDWLILKSLRRGPRRRLGELAEELGVSVRTLNRRMERLVEGYAYYLEIQVNYQKVAGLGFTLVVRYADPDWKAHVDEMILERLGGSYEWSDTRSNPEFSVFSAFSSNFGEAEQIYRWARSLKGIADARMGIQEGRHMMGSWIDSEIQSRTASAPTAKELVAMEVRQVTAPVLAIGAPKREAESWWTGSLVEGRNVKVQIDAELCMGSASCVAMAPRVFRLDWAKKRSSMTEPAPLEILKTKGTEPESLFLAAQSCPYGVIKIEDADTGEQLFP